MKYKRTALALIGVVLAAVVIGSQGTASPLTSANARHDPLLSALASPSQLDTCATKAIAHTAASFYGKAMVTHKQQVYHRADNDELAELSPKLAALTPYFDVLMNMVRVQGRFTVRGRSFTEITYILTPYPSCSVTAWLAGDR